MKVSFDDSDFKKKSGEFLALVKKRTDEKRRDIAEEIMRLSQMEVPHDTGELQNSGSVEHLQDYSIVGYNKVYAAHLHEHPEYHFQKGRKGKYLEDPIKNNLNLFKQILGDVLS